MKKIYIRPNVDTLHIATAEFLATSSEGTGGYNAGDDTSQYKETGSTSASSGSGLSQCSKKFNAWDTWDED